MIKKILAIALALLMLLPMVISCSKKDGEEKESTSDVVTTDDGDGLYDSNGYLKDKLPDLDFENADVNILGWDSYSTHDFYAESGSGNTISESIVTRNNKVMDRLNVKLNVVQIPGGYADMESFVSHVIASSMSSDDSFDLIASYSMTGGTLAMQGLIQPLDNAEYLDMSAPWWVQKINDRSRIGDSLYFAAGLQSNSLIFATSFLCVNMNMIEELQLDDPRQFVKDGTWTFEKLQQMVKDSSQELDREEGLTVGDIIGYTSYNDIDCDAWVASTGYAMTETDENGYLRLSNDWTGDKTYTVVTKISNWLHTSPDVFYDHSKAPKNAIMAGRVLFGGIAGEVAVNFGNVPFTYSFVPYPKTTADQDDYSCLLAFVYSVWSVPTNVEDFDRSTAVLECMASEGYRGSYAILRDKVFKSRFSNDAIDAEMIDIIINSGYTDPARIFNASFESSPVFAARSVVRSNATTWVSDMEKLTPAVNNVLKNISRMVAG